ncbi:hypothetical protein C8F04DRAFT_1250425 [Mycena alexandri]|uniref:Uncharacterized protein n=1 Tax=Mycena alexandri TaxID=1745969 RepID=A0AAD6XDX6_9AGAR|nr:hypothetical protein C8F04DRAFT_1250425 [Mycena alexandri]
METTQIGVTDLRKIFPFLWAWVLSPLLPYKEEHSFKLDIAKKLLTFRQADRHAVQTLLEASKAEFQRAQAEFQRAQAEMMLAASRTQYFTRLFDVADQNVDDAQFQIAQITLEGGLGALSTMRAEEAEKVQLKKPGEDDFGLSITLD